MLLELENVIDFRTFTGLRRMKNVEKIRKINLLDDEEERVIAMRKFFV